MPIYDLGLHCSAQELLSIYAMSNWALLISYDVTQPVFKPKFANQAFYDFYNVTHEQWIHQAHLDSTPVYDIIIKCIESDIPITSIESLAKPRNGARVVEWVHVPVKDDEGKIIEVIGVGTPLR